MEEIMIHKRNAPKDHEKITFVIKALSENGYGTFTSVVHVEGTRNGSRVIATDGKRIHIAILDTKIPNGNYVPLVKGYAVYLKSPSTEITYPAWRNVIPEQTRFKTEIDIEEFHNGVTLTGAEKLSLAYHTIIGKTGRAINVRYLGDLSEHTWKVYSEKDKTQSLVFKDSKEGDSLFAVIAPLAV